MARKLTYEEVKNYIEIESNSKCKLLSDKYINNRTNMLFRCKCGNVFETTLRSFKDQNKRQCNICGNKLKYTKQVRTQKQFKNIVSSMVGDEYKIVGEYKNANTKIAILHSRCGYEYMVKPNHFIHTGTRCPKCSAKIAGEKQAKTHKEFAMDIYNLYKEEYTLLGNYVNAKTKIRVKHNLCNYEWYVVPDSLLRGHSCPKCAISKGENRIALYLDSNSIDYKIQHTFEDCKNINLLPFDFYLSMYNLLIEYDGEQHYRPVNFGGCKDEEAIESYRRTVHNDNIKNKYCKDNNIPLLRIPYWDFDNIEKILEKWLKTQEITKTPKNPFGKKRKVEVSMFEGCKKPLKCRF